MLTLFYRDDTLHQVNAGDTVRSFDKMRFTFVSRVQRILDEHERRRDLITWIESALSQPDSLQRYRQLERGVRKAQTGSEEIDWDDLRIREYVAAEVEHVADYQKWCERYASTRNSWAVGLRICTMYLADKR